jgi:hypothetical protein
MNEHVNFREVLGSSHEFKESLREEFQINIDSIWKILVMNWFLNHNSWIFLSENICVLSLFQEKVPKPNLYVNYIY